MGKIAKPPFSLGCLVCGVDSGPIRTFLIVFIGSLVGATLLTLAWARISGRLRDREDLASGALNAEGISGEKNDH